ncbi:MAG: LytTR family transcriptional regulator DNA-binding domain-containing protein [Cyclobacteriaceae bacterium]
MTNAISILVVEDEFLIAEDLRIQLGLLQYEVELAKSFDDAMNKLKGGNIDLVILDVNLGSEKDGIDLADHINKVHYLPYIFLSSLSSPEVIARAKKVHPYAYLLKPFNLREIQIAIELALVNYSRNYGTQTVLAGKEESEKVLPVRDSLFLKNRDRYEKVSFNEILYLEASSNYTTIYTRKGNYVYSKLLRNFEEKLPKDHFLRVHRTYIVNIKMIEGYEGNSLFVGDNRIPVSQTHRSTVFRLLNTL